MSAVEMTTGGQPRPGTRRNLDDQVYEHLKTMIAHRSLLSGQRIEISQLSHDLGVSRTPLLSALKRLSQEQLVEWRSRRGVFVRRLSLRELALVFELREVLEGLSARRAASVIEPAQVDALRALFRDIAIDAPETPERRRAYMVQDYAFHTGLVEIAGSLPLTQTIRSVNVMVAAFGGGLIRPIREVMGEHQPIFEALMRRDPEKAEAAMRIHVRRSVEWLHHEADLHEQASRSALSSRPDKTRREEEGEP
jgi:GntR family transcriptional regulator, vanillate catabolism transcriptional regulator